MRKNVSNCIIVAYTHIHNNVFTYIKSNEFRDATFKVFNAIAAFNTVGQWDLHSLRG
jgi:hypothetical protein